MPDLHRGFNIISRLNKDTREILVLSRNPKGYYEGEISRLNALIASLQSQAASGGSEAPLLPVSAVSTPIDARPPLTWGDPSEPVHISEPIANSPQYRDYANGSWSYDPDTDTITATGHPNQEAQPGVGFRMYARDTIDREGYYSFIAYLPAEPVELYSFFAALYDADRTENKLSASITTNHFSAEFRKESEPDRSGNWLRKEHDKTQIFYIKMGVKKGQYFLRVKNKEIITTYAEGFDPGYPLRLEVNQEKGLEIRNLKVIYETLADLPTPSLDEQIADVTSPFTSINTESVQVITETWDAIATNPEANPEQKTQAVEMGEFFGFTIKNLYAEIEQYKKLGLPQSLIDSKEAEILEKKNLYLAWTGQLNDNPNLTFSEYLSGRASAETDLQKAQQLWGMVGNLRERNDQGTWANDEESHEYQVASAAMDILNNARGTRGTETDQEKEYSQTLYNEWRAEMAGKPIERVTPIDEWISDKNKSGEIASDWLFSMRSANLTQANYEDYLRAAMNHAEVGTMTATILDSVSYSFNSLKNHGNHNWETMKFLLNGYANYVNEMVKLGQFIVPFSHMHDHKFGSVNPQYEHLWVQYIDPNYR